LEITSGVNWWDVSNLALVDSSDVSPHSWVVGLEKEWLQVWGSGKCGIKGDVARSHLVWIELKTEGEATSALEGISKIETSPIDGCGLLESLFLFNMSLSQGLEASLLAMVVVIESSSLELLMELIVLNSFENFSSTCADHDSWK